MKLTITHDIMHLGKVKIKKGEVVEVLQEKVLYAGGIRIRTKDGLVMIIDKNEETVSLPRMRVIFGDMTHGSFCDANGDKVMSMTVIHKTVRRMFVHSYEEAVEMQEILSKKYPGFYVGFIIEETAKQNGVQIIYL